MQGVQNLEDIHAVRVGARRHDEASALEAVASPQEAREALPHVLREPATLGTPLAHVALAHAFPFSVLSLQSSRRRYRAGGPLALMG
jgi:hypothetical protein